MCERVRMNRFDQVQNRVHIVAGIGRDENERHRHDECERNYSFEFSYTQHVESFNTHSNDRLPCREDP